ncbi:MAG: cell division protein FtsQ [Halieaceae bacterium]|jgi:cell division protein FtsQ
MAASRSNTRRRPQQRLREHLTRLQALLPGLMSVLALALVAVLAYRAFLGLYAMPVERIVVSGKLEHLRQEAVRSLLAERMDRGLLFLNLRTLRRELETLPWVYRAQLRRRFPDTLEVRVLEQVPIARWGDEGFLNHEARVIFVADQQQGRELPSIRGQAGSEAPLGRRYQQGRNLPSIRGPEGHEALLMNRYQQLLDRLQAVRLTPSALREDEFGQLQVEMSSGLLLHLGAKDFSGRLEQFLLLWRGDLQDRAATVRRVDMRYASGAAVAYSQPQLAGEAEHSGGV